MEEILKATDKNQSTKEELSTWEKKHISTKQLESFKGETHAFNKKTRGKQFQSNETDVMPTEKSLNNETNSLQIVSEEQEYEDAIEDEIETENQMEDDTKTENQTEDEVEIENQTEDEDGEIGLKSESHATDKDGQEKVTVPNSEISTNKLSEEKIKSQQTKRGKIPTPPNRDSVKAERSQSKRSLANSFELNKDLHVASSKEQANAKLEISSK